MKHMKKHSKNGTRSTISLTAVALAAVLTVTGCSLGKSEAPDPVDTTIRVMVDTASRGDISVRSQYIGRVEPDQQVAVIPRTMGEVLAAYYNVGDRVEVGDVLFEIDATDIQLQVDIAQAGFNSAQASVNQALGSTLEAQILQAESGLKNAQAAYKTAQNMLSATENSVDVGVDVLKDSRREVREGIKNLEEQIAALTKLIREKEKELEDLRAGRGGSNALGYSAGMFGNAGAETELPPGVEDLLGTKEAQLMLEIYELNETLKALRSALSSAEASEKQLDAQIKTTQAGGRANLTQLQSSINSASVAVQSAEDSVALLNQKVVPQAQEVAMAQMSSAEAQLKAARRQLEFAKVTAPISGVIEMRNVEPNNMVSSQNPAYVISNKDMMAVSFRVPETVVASLSLGDVVLLDKNGQTCEAVISEIPTMIDANSGLFAVKATVENPSFTMLTGAAIKVDAVTSQAKNALMVPVDYLYYDEGKPFLYLHRDGKAVKTFVEIGIADDESVQIVSGISASDEIITTWNAHLKDGVEIEIG